MVTHICKSRIQEVQAGALPIAMCSRLAWDNRVRLSQANKQQQRIPHPRLPEMNIDLIILKIWTYCT